METTTFQTEIADLRAKVARQNAENAAERELIFTGVRSGMKSACAGMLEAFGSGQFELEQCPRNGNAGLLGTVDTLGDILTAHTTQQLAFVDELADIVKRRDKAKNKRRDKAKKRRKK